MVAVLEVGDLVAGDFLNSTLNALLLGGQIAVYRRRSRDRLTAPNSSKLGEATYEDLVAWLRTRWGKSCIVVGGEDMMLKAYRDASGTRSLEIACGGIGPWRG